MIVYWLMFSSVLLFVLLETANSSSNHKLEHTRYQWWVVFFIILIVVGFRSEVGGDWFAYLTYFERVQGIGLLEAFLLKDPGYMLLNYFVYNIGGNIYLVNIFSASIFISALIAFCKKQPRPMLSILMAVPYMVIVVAMGYTRQSLALGFTMFAMVAFINKSPIKFLLWIFIATTFHKTAAIFLFFTLFLDGLNRILVILLFVCISLFTYIFFWLDASTNFYTTYVESGAQSSGTLVRLWMSFIPALLYLIFKRYFDVNKTEHRITLIYSIASILAVMGYLIYPGSTAIDRMAIYLLPLQLLVISRLPNLFKNNSKTLVVLGIIIYYFLVQFVWLFFSANKAAWLPYKFYPFTFI